MHPRCRQTGMAVAGLRALADVFGMPDPSQVASNGAAGPTASTTCRNVVPSLAPPRFKTARCSRLRGACHADTEENQRRDLASGCSVHRFRLVWQCCTVQTDRPVSRKTSFEQVHRQARRSSRLRPASQASQQTQYASFAVISTSHATAAPQGSQTTRVGRAGRTGHSAMGLLGRSRDCRPVVGVGGWAGGQRGTTHITIDTSILNHIQQTSTQLNVSFAMYSHH
jgi:hypothetical protein